MERAAKARTTPLDRDEEAAWRAIARAVLVVPRTLDADLLAGCGLSLAEYIVLVNLSEAPGNSMRMHELAVESTLSPSGVTRLIERMERQGLVEREQAAADARGMTATLTGAGLGRLRDAYPPRAGQRADQRHRPPGRVRPSRVRRGRQQIRHRGNGMLPATPRPPPARAPGGVTGTGSWRPQASHTTGGTR
jgi:DNA-binding MarR family transcriptional regulator